MTIELDDLWREAKQVIRATAAAKLKAKADAPPLDPRAIYTNPDNWERTRGIALIHADTETLLGSFDEWTHRKIVNCRRLVRATQNAMRTGAGVGLGRRDRDAGISLLGGHAPPHSTQRARCRRCGPEESR